MNTREDVKLLAGIVALTIYNEDEEVDILHPRGISVFFQVNLPREINGWSILGGEKYSLSYHFLNKPGKKTVIRWDNKILEHGILSDEDLDYFGNLFLPLAKDIETKAKVHGLFNEISCTKEAQIIGFKQFEDFEEGVIKVRREWFDFFFDKDYNIAEAKSLFRHYVVDGEEVYSLIPNEKTTESFIETPHTDRERRKTREWPNTNFEAVESWLKYYWLVDPITLKVEVSDEMKRYIVTHENTEDWKYMTREEYEAASKANPEKYPPVPKKKNCYTQDLEKADLELIVNAKKEQDDEIRVNFDVKKDGEVTSSNKVVFWNDGGFWCLADYDSCREDEAKFELVCMLFSVDQNDVMGRVIEELLEKDETTFSFEI